MSRDALPYVADIVADGDAILRYIDGVGLEAFAANGWDVARNKVPEIVAELRPLLD